MRGRYAAMPTESGSLRRLWPRAARLALGLALLFGAAACERSAAPAHLSAEPAPPERIVSLAPSITELVFALGAGERLVGVSAQCDMPPAARALPKVGNYGAPNIELVLAARPDLVIAPAEGALLAPLGRLEALGVAVQTLEIDSLEALYVACERLGRRLGRAAQGRALARRLRARAERIAAALRGAARPSVLVVLDHQPIVAAGPQTFIDALIRAAGGRNALAHAPLRWPQLGEEALLQLDPDLIVDLSMQEDERNQAVRARLWARLRGLSAVAAERVRSADPDLFVRPGPRLIDGLELLARWLHPERFEGAGAAAGGGAAR